MDWCATRDFKVTRQKLADHKNHITDPKETLVDHARRNPAIKNNVSNDEFLQAIIDIGYQKAIEDPDNINVGHALKAAQVREARKQANTTNVLMLFAAASMGLPTNQPEVIEGAAWKELPMEGQ